MLDAHQLNVFLIAANTLNFTAAARQLHMTQPSVSQHIQSLEQHFDTDLFIRSGRHLRLTDAGAALVPLAQKMVNTSLNIEEMMETLKGEVHGHLLVGCSTTIGKYILPMLLAEFMRQYPKVAASCYVKPRDVAVQMLCEGNVHLALSSSNEFCRDVELCHFISDPVILIAPLNHPLAEMGEIYPEDLLNVDLIMREEGSGTLNVVSNALREFGIGISDLRTVLTLGNSEAIALAVQEGIGVGFVSQIIVSRLVKDDVVTIPVRGLTMQQDIFIGQHTSHAATAAQTAFWEFVTQPNNVVVNKITASYLRGESSEAPVLEAAIN